MTSDNPLIQKLAAGTAVTCLPVRVSRSIHVVQMAKAGGFDALYFDMEHSTIGLETVSSLSLAAWYAGIVPLVRVPSHDPELMLRSLEGGAAGLIVPHVHTAQTAREIVAAVRFRPRGRRAMAGASPPLGYAMLSGDDAAAVLDARTLLIVMIESTQGVANADAICAVDGIDLVLVGTGDLSDELGVHGRAEDPRIRAAYETIAAACRRHGRWLGVAGIKRQPALIRDLRELGATFITSSTDESLLLAAIHEESRTLEASFR